MPLTPASLTPVPLIPAPLTPVPLTPSSLTPASLTPESLTPVIQNTRLGDPVTFHLLQSQMSSLFTYSSSLTATQTATQGVIFYPVP
jgi:hypothetical protein